MKYSFLGLVAGLLTLFLAAGCSDSDSPPATTTTGTTGNAEPPVAAPPSEVPGASEPDQGPVAVVNGEEISRAEFEMQFSQIEASYAQQGVPFPTGVELAQLQEETVRQMVQQELVLQETEAQGITASDEEIETELQAAIASFPDEGTFDETIAAQGLSRDEVSELLAENIKITKLLDSVIEQAQLQPPSEEELRELYDLAIQQQELPPFEEIRGELEAEVQSQREDEVLQAFVQELEAAGSVELLMTS